MSRTQRGPAPDPASLTPWDRARDESSQSFAAFVLYRDMGPERTLKRVAAAAGRKLQATKNLAAKWCWTARAREFDRWTDKAAQQLLVARRAEAIDRHARIGRLLQGKALEAAAKLQPDAATASGVARMAAEGVKIERLALGESTDNVDSKVEFAGLGDALRALRKRREAEEK